jgi:acetolactate synthase-1/2/3 large subunit
MTAPGRIAAEDFLEALAAHGVDHLFVNPGTDFAPIVEALARARRSNRAVPRATVVPHENAAVAMAHGYTMMTGRPQAVMLHTNVGTANAINMLINVARDRTPMLLASGRTPLTEHGPAGARSAHIHWAQEMFDQAGMLREIVKWDYELRRADQVAGVLARGFEIATAQPAGPVYLSLPREVLAEAAAGAAAERRTGPAAPHPSAGDIETLAGWLAEARRPLIITADAGKHPGESEALAAVADRYAIPVVPYNPRYFALSGTHPMYAGPAPGPLLGEADLVIVLECDVPWLPSKEGPPSGARVVHIGVDPLFARYPMRGYPCDLAITAGVVPALAALAAALAPTAAMEARRHVLASAHATLREGWRAQAERDGAGGAITLPWLNACLREVVDDDTVVFSEYSFRQEYCPLRRPGSLFALSPAGGLGWGLPAAIGAKLAVPERQVVAVLGDGAYMFANPTACHATAAEQRLPVLAVLFNNGRYNAVRRATLDMYRDGVAGEDDGRLLADFGHATAYERIMDAHGGYGERVERPADLPAALRRAAERVRAGQQAVVNVICSA